MMYRIKYLVLGIIVCSFIAACHRNQKGAQAVFNDSLNANATPDSTVYGICGQGTAMHTLQLITDSGDTIDYLLNTDTPPETQLHGGLLVGDRMAVVGTEIENERVALHVLNLTSLFGRWKSIDKDFEVQEDGIVKSFLQNEHHAWTAWKLLNGKLLLDRDTFDINTLGADTLALENKDGIFVYQRKK